MIYPVLLFFYPARIRVVGRVTARRKSTPIAWIAVEVQGVDFVSGDRTILAVCTFSRSVPYNIHEKSTYIRLGRNQFHKSQCLSIILHANGQQLYSRETLWAINELKKQYIWSVF